MCTTLPFAHSITAASIASHRIVCSCHPFISLQPHRSDAHHQPAGMTMTSSIHMQTD